MNLQDFEACLSTGPKINDKQRQHLFQFLKVFQVEAAKINLTGMKDEEDIAIKLILDSIIPLQFSTFPHGSRLADLGTGGGFPGIPLAILSPESTFTLIDSRKKKLDAIDRMINALKLENVSTLWSRAEDLTGHTPKFNFVTTKAFAALPKTLRLAMPLLESRGTLIAYIGPGEDIESQEVAKLEKQYDLDHKVESYELPKGKGTHRLAYFSKRD